MPSTLSASPSPSGKRLPYSPRLQPAFLSDPLSLSPSISHSVPLRLSICLSIYPSVRPSIFLDSPLRSSSAPSPNSLYFSLRSSVLRASSTELSIYLSSSPCVSISPSIALASSVYLSLCPSPPPPPLSLFLSVYFSILLSISPPR